MKTCSYGPLDYAKTLKLQFRVGGLNRPERRGTRSREGEQDAQMCPCGKAKESRSDIVEECETYKEECDVLEMRKVAECDIEKFSTLPGRQ